MNYILAPFSASNIYCAIIIVASLTIIFVLHVLSEGRTTPLAVVSSVLVALLSAIAVSCMYGFREVYWRNELVGLVETHPDAPILKDLIFYILAGSTVVGTIAAIVTAFFKRHEWFNHLRRVR